jgi:predicted nucleic acid-binding protein
MPEFTLHDAATGPTAPTAPTTATGTLSASPAFAPRAVLDTNVWIDILVFDDPSTRPIRAALDTGRLIAVTDARCVKELSYVLDYPQFARYALDKTAVMASVARLAEHYASPVENAYAAAATAGVLASAPAAAPECAPLDCANLVRPPLPRCRDRDDQKFLELAYASGADWLVSKDRDVLKMARRIARDFDFRIAAPSPFAHACGLLEC